MPWYSRGRRRGCYADGGETQNIENYATGTGRTFRVPAPGYRRPHDIIGGDDVMTGVPSRCRDWVMVKAMMS